MSTDFIVYAKRRKVPGGSDFVRILGANGRVRFPEPPDFLRHEGFLPVLLDGRLSGFEVFVSKITRLERIEAREEMEEDDADDDYEQRVRILSSCNVRITLCAHDDHERTAAELVARALAVVCDGYFCDPQSGETCPSPGGM